eukprot:TRINITY_DN1501_c0_g1_i1.p1 TRINITY_DN1501_c0_g1~~TRINITY_DN1501_c0_g1_i1.p1  ORF type:complete len:565 (+),score=123.65 TRINITY_DN1501_c0_g1_i1:113-1696(+)
MCIRDRPMSGQVLRSFKSGIPDCSPNRSRMHSEGLAPSGLRSTWVSTPVSHSKKVIGNGSLNVSAVLTPNTLNSVAVHHEPPLVSDYYDFTPSCQSKNSAKSELSTSKAYLGAMKALQDKIKIMDRQILEMKAEKERIEVAHSSSVDDLQKSFREQISAQREVENSLRENVGRLEGQVEEMRRTIAELNKEIRQRREVKEERDQLEQEKEALKKALSELSGKFEATRGEKMRAQLDSDALRTKSDSLRMEYEIDRKTWENKVGTLESQISILQNERDIMQQNHDTRVKILENDKNKLYADLCALTAINEALRKEVVTANEEMRRRDGELVTLRTSVEYLQREARQRARDASSRSRKARAPSPAEEAETRPYQPAPENEFKPPRRTSKATLSPLNYSNSSNEESSFHVRKASEPYFGLHRRNSSERLRKQWSTSKEQTVQEEADSMQKSNQGSPANESMNSLMSASQMHPENDKFALAAKKKEQQLRRVEYEQIVAAIIEQEKEMIALNKAYASLMEKLQVCCQNTHC